MKTLHISLFFLWIGLANCYYGDYPEAYYLTPGNKPKSYAEFSAEVREAQRMRSGHADASHLLREYELIKEEAFSINIKDGIPEEYQGNFTAECWADWGIYVGALTGSVQPLWALRMIDSTGLLDPGMLDGDLFFEGRYSECERATYSKYFEPDYPLQPLHCVAYWPQDVFESRTRGRGICIPDTCTDEDAENLIRTVFNPMLPATTKIQVRCERGKPDLSEDPQAIITIIIYSLFGFLVILATIYHYFYVEIEGDQPVSDKHSRDNKKTDKAEPEQYVSGIKSPNENIPQEKSKVDEPTLKSYKQTNGEINQGFTADGKETIELQANGDALPDTLVHMQEGGNTHCRNKKRVDQLNKIEQLLLAFSMYVNVPLITTTKQAKGAYGCLNGIRFLAFCAVILGHTYVLGTVGTPATIANEFYMFMKLLDPSYYKIVTMDVYVDTFFILSAFLVAIGLLRKFDRTNGNLGVSGWIMHYFSRYYRLTATYFMVLLFMSNMKEYLYEGPFMKDTVWEGGEWNCQAYWWANLLYINNFFIYDTCMGHTWYLAVDMQMFIIAPLFLYVLWRWPKAGICFNVAGFCGGIIATGVLKHKVYTQTAVPGDDDYVDDFVDIYIKPWCRCPVYFMGLLLGYFFFRTGGKVKMPWWVVAIGWFVAVSMWVLVSYLPALQVCTELSICGDWTPEDMTAYYTLNRIMWGIWVCWLILACATGYGGFINTFLSWKFYVPLGKLTYLGYLIHSIFTFGYFMGSPIQQYYYDYFFMYLFFANILIVHLCSLLMAFTVSAPLMGIMGVFLPSMKGKSRR